ncbi:MAG: amidohydrolase [Clostridia bacterium]|nr:amidohydrolase [Clostridia bacterium]
MSGDNRVAAVLLARGKEISGDIIAWRRALHAMPELRMDTPMTEAFIVKTLRELGVTDIRAGVGGHGVVALIKGDLPGPCLAIRADCDGLPIKEETGLPFASQNGNMHACGHDAHTAIALGAAKLLTENKSRLRGSVKLIFQPYEEGDGGARAMIADGALDNPQVDAIIALHNHPTECAAYEAGDILVTPEPTSASIYAYEATFYGTPAHVCLSNESVNPVHMACTAVAEIAALPNGEGRIINAVPVINGGVRNNVIPETCTVCGSIRSFDAALHKATVARVGEILLATAERFGGHVEVKTSIDLMATEIDRPLYDSFLSAMNTLFPERGGVERRDREIIGEDFARFAACVPAVYFMLHTAPCGGAYPLHHPKFDVNESVLYRGSLAFAGFALLWQEKE